MNRSNPQDPLLKVGPDAERKLFELFVATGNGYPFEATIGAAINLLVNALRQQHPTRAQALQALDQWLARARTILLELHYDSVGRRKGIFPYDQVINLDHFDARPKRN